jgi:salicylate hydroxylase
MTVDTTSAPTLRVAVIGSGIAGLAAAAFLRKHPQFIITVYELRGADFKESSAALGLQTNGTSIVEQLGITREEVRGVTGAGYRTYNIREEPMSKGKVAFPPDGETGFWFVHRQDLKDALLRRVISEDEDGELIQVVYDSHIVEIDPEAGIMKFADRPSVEMDLIIGKSNESSYVTTIQLTFFTRRR